VWLSQLALVNFRNLRRLRLEPQPGVLLFYGRNGQGKTNLLESIYVLATTRSPRTSVERELLSWQADEDLDLAAVITPFARLEGRVRRLEGEVHLEVSFETQRNSDSDSASPPVGRSIKVNGLLQRAAGLVGQPPVVYFSPDDVALASGSPAGRRQYLNLANSQASATHLRALQRYNRVLLQRNQVLRQVRERRQPASALEPWTEQMVQYGSQVLHQRLEMLARVDERAAAIFPELSGLPDQLSIRYRATACDAGETTQPEELESSFRERQQRVAAREIEQAVSLIGPHRDDFSFHLDGVDLNVYGSRGQQRLAVLALKLAEADWMRAEVGELPVVLLDDVLSELDPERRRYVLQRVAAPEPSNQRQVWITSTDDTDLSEPLVAAAQRFQIDAGRVRPA